MNDWAIRFAEADVGEEEIRAVAEVIRSKWLAMGKVTEKFEKDFAEKLGVRHAFAVSNGTAALHLANLALGIGPGDEVICPVLTFVASANASAIVGASVRFADVVSETDLTVDPKDIEAQITTATRAITVVHFAGFACHMDEIMTIAGRHGLKVIEDCAHAPFSTYRGAGGGVRHLGGIGDFGCFSFYANKNMTTGEGGMVTTNSDDLAERIRLLRSHGMTSLAYERYRRHASGYDVAIIGLNYRADDIKSAIGLVQLGKIDEINERQRRVFGWYLEELKGSPNVIVPFADRDLSESTCHIMVVIIRNGQGEIRKRLTEAGIQTSVHYTPIPEFTAYGKRGYDGKLRGSRGLLSLPMSSFLTRENVRLICGIVRSLDKE
jgi:dTDP-4-amino-4,6-dideoxygalactose transaminase